MMELLHLAHRLLLLKGQRQQQNPGKNSKQNNDKER